ncbi:MAG: Uma2 family endonuclease [Frankiaceae bacterium]|nr:Uma2 family endonuclease [Frankiaceae bacterium]
MTAMTVMPRDGDWTVDDLLDLPDDGLQYELADGVLLVTPAPRPRHQRTIRKLLLVLDPLVPDDMEVFFAPLDFQPTRIRSLQPDLLVVRRSDVGELNITAPLLLAVEVLSPSTRAKDLILKKGLYEDSGVPSYWVIDPDEQTLVAWELDGGSYREVARLGRGDVFRTDRPFPLHTEVAALFV